MIVFYVVLTAVLLLLAAILFSIFPSQRKHPDRNRLKGLYIAHRGLHGIYPDTPENSLAAFSAAASAGFAIEIDIKLTKDAQVVIFHDDDLFRMCGIHGRIEDMTLDELRRLRLNGSREGIPTLAECLSVVGGRVPLLIEYKCKSGSATPICEAANKILSEYNGEYFIQSFYPLVLKWYKTHRKDVCRGQLSTAFKKDKLHMKMLGCLLFNFFGRPDFVSYEFSFAKHPMRRLCTKLGAFPVGWTFKSENDIVKYGEYFDAYIFEGFTPKK